jgi:hypothetical protein
MAFPGLWLSCVPASRVSARYSYPMQLVLVYTPNRSIPGTMTKQQPVSTTPVCFGTREQAHRVPLPHPDTAEEHMPLHMSMHMPIRMSADMPLHMSIPMSVHMSIRTCMRMSIHMPIHRSIFFMGA